MKYSVFWCAVVLMLFFVVPSSGADLRNDATPYTIAINTAENLSDTWQNLADDSAFVHKGLLVEVDPVIIRSEKGADVINTTYFSFLNNETAPVTIQNSLYQHAQFNSVSGLFQVTDSVYQVRGFDLAVMSFIKGDTGWIVIDPLSSVDTAKAAYDLVNTTLGAYPIKAVIYTHSHVDHYQGVKGVASDAAVAAGDIVILAPEGFMEHAVSENIYAGTAMQRRAMYMYGTYLPVDEKGYVDSGLGTTSSLNGSSSLIAPTVTIQKTGERLVIDGVVMEFQITPGTEAPAEMNVWFPEKKALCLAENCVGTFHNILTIRGAEVRDPLAWSNYLDEALRLYGSDAEVLFTSHNWPRFGNGNVTSVIENQRDMYKYVHDQALHLMNQGYTMDEISHMITLPDSLRKYGYTHEFYGTVQMAVKAVYQKYLGFYDGNPTHLYNPDPAGFAVKMVEYMGGADAVIPKLREDYAAGNYQEVATIAGYLVFADPSNYEARYLQADALEQLGYQSVSGPYRNAYLSAAQELRASPEAEEAFLHRPAKTSLGSADVMNALSFDQICQYLAIQLNVSRAEDVTLSLQLNMTSPEGPWGGLLLVQNSVLHAWEGVTDPNADAVISGNKSDFVAYIADGEYSPDGLARIARISGDAGAVNRFLGMLEPFALNFNIILP